MKCKMVVVDLDGTLLHDNESISSKSIGVISRLKEMGILFVIATSRSYSSAAKYIDVLKPDALVTSGGAIARIGDKVIYKAVLTKEQVNDCIKRCLQERFVNFIRIEGTEYDMTNNPLVSDNEMEFGHYKKTDFMEYIEQEAYKITIHSENHRAIKEMFVGDKNCSLITSYAGENVHKLTQSFAAKEFALAQIIKFYNISYKDVISFGDDLSDIMMLSNSGIGVAVNNALCSVKKVADFICGSNEEDGVANFLLKELEKIDG